MEVVEHDGMPFTFHSSTENGQGAGTTRSSGSLTQFRRHARRNQDSWGGVGGGGVGGRGREDTG